MFVVICTDVGYVIVYDDVTSVDYVIVPMNVKCQSKKLSVMKVHAKIMHSTNNNQ